MAAPPNFVIGDNYLRRWWILKKLTIGKRSFNTDWLSCLYVHKIAHDDEDRALHDHRSFTISIILTEGYDEVMPARRLGRWFRPTEYTNDFEIIRRNPGDIIIRRPRSLHRLVVNKNSDGSPKPAITLFYTGPHLRNWGFRCLKGWVPYQRFVAKDDHGQVGLGCAALDH